MKNKTKAEEHFDTISEDYDKYKTMNWYYYANLKKLYADLMPRLKSKTVLEVGCGTGTLLANMKAKRVVGYDISKGMIDLAKKKFPHIEFHVMSAENVTLKEQFDYVFLADVIEHLEDVTLTIQNLKKVSNKRTKIIITMANPLWEPILMLGEKLKLKMPEGPHYRIPYRKLKTILAENNFKVIERGYRVLVPFNIPILKEINRFFYKIPLLRNLGLIEFLVIRVSQKNK